MNSNVTLTRRHAIKKPEKWRTTIYLLPRHKTHLQFLVDARGTSMTEVICWLIDQSARTMSRGK